VSAKKKPPAVRASRPARRRGRRPSWSDVQPERYADPTRFSEHPQLGDAFQLAVLLKQHRWLLDPLRERISAVPKTESRPGAKRRDGDWVLLYLYYVRRRYVSVRHFWAQEQSTRIWELCDFGDWRPHHETIRLRFNELEEHADAFRDASVQLVRRAKRHDPLIGRIVHADATGWTTYARLEHCCPDAAACRRKGGKPPRYVRRLADSAIDEARRADAEQELAEGELPASVSLHRATDRLYRYFEIRGHLYRTRDRSAGLRAYTGAPRLRSWLGGYGFAGWDDRTNLMVVADAFSASEQEPHRLEPLVDAVTRALGEEPLVVTGDRGHTIERCFEALTRRGISPAFPHRKHAKRPDRASYRSERFDEHGIPRCRHCGGEGDADLPGLGLGFDRSGDPYLAFVCRTRHRVECGREQRVTIQPGEFRFLLPLSRKHPLYHDALALHEEGEAHFGYMRERYATFGKERRSALRRWSASVSAQHLRAQASIALDWFMFQLRHGWLNGLTGPVSVRTYARVGDGALRLQRLLSSRRRKALDVPYGPAAEQLGLRVARAGP
jgi:hypothetical protein